MLLAMLPARLPPYNALPAMLDAWLNLSQREKANVLVTVRTSAIAKRRCAELVSYFLFFFLSLSLPP